MDTVKVTSSLDFGPSKLKQAPISFSILVFLYQEARRFWADEYQEQQDDGGDYRGR
jgi:hypothetical protein